MNQYTQETCPGGGQGGTGVITGIKVNVTVHCYHAQSAIFLRQYLECVEFIYIANLSFVTHIRERFGMRMVSLPF